METLDKQIIKKISSEKGGEIAAEGTNKYNLGQLVGSIPVKKEGLRQKTEGLIMQNPLRMDKVEKILEVED